MQVSESRVRTGAIAGGVVAAPIAACASGRWGGLAAGLIGGGALGAGLAALAGPKESEDDAMDTTPAGDGAMIGAATLGLAGAGFGAIGGPDGMIAGALTGLFAGALAGAATGAGIGATIDGLT